MRKGNKLGFTKMVLVLVQFHVYMNDSSDGVVPDESSFSVVKLMMRMKTGEKERLQMDLDNLHDWLDKWSLEYNPSKCKVTKTGEGARRQDRGYRFYT